MTNTNKNNQYQYNNNGKSNPNNVVLYLYTTYNTSSFHPISVIAFPLILIHPRGFCVEDDIQLSVFVVKLQIILFTVWEIRQVAGYKIILLKSQLIEPRIQPLVEDNTLDLWNLNWAVSMILDLLFAIWIGSSKILTVSTLLPLLDFWINQNSTSIGPSKRILNDYDVSAKK